MSRMAPTQHDSAAAPLVVELEEWDRVGPEHDRRLAGVSIVGNPKAERIAQALGGRMQIRQRHDGLEVATTSFVGVVEVGPLRIVVRPKLPASPLACLLRYAYGLRDLATLDATQVSTLRHELHDLLVAMLATEAEELLHRGLARRYVAVAAKLDSPRGRLLVADLARAGGLREPRLPCLHFERRADWPLNRVLHAGLASASTMTADSGLRRRVHRLMDLFGDVTPSAGLKLADVELAQRGLTRLTAAYGPALTIVHLLQAMRGADLQMADRGSAMPGFLFDMNRFFQRLLPRFLHDNLTTARIADEWGIRHVFAYAPGANPKHRNAPAPRPDFALFQGHAPHAFLDAKYRDIWARGLPPEWLYQLSIYALSSPARTSVVLYASTSADARDEKIEIREPFGRSNGPSASVVVRPVPLLRLAELVAPEHTARLANERRGWANQLVAVHPRLPNRA